MRVSATALRQSDADAVGALELECTLAGLQVDLHGLAAAQNGFAPGGFVSGTRVVVPFNEIVSAVSHEDALQIPGLTNGPRHKEVSSCLIIRQLLLFGIGYY